LVEERLLKCSFNLIAMKKKILFLLVGTTSLVVSIKQEAKGAGINPLRMGLRDTLVLSADVNTKADKAKSDSTHHVTYPAPIIKGAVIFCPGDPDGIAQLSAAPDAAVVVRAKAQMKAYLDDLIIDPESIGLKTAKDLVKREIDESYANSEVSIYALWQANLLPLK
jgi:hypothetical protein